MGRDLTLLLPVFFSSRDARGRPPPEAEGIGKLPSFHPRGLWDAEDLPEAPWPSQGLRAHCEPLLQIITAVGTSLSQVSTGTERIRGDLGGCGPQRRPEMTAGLWAMSRPRASRMSPLRCPGARGYGLGVSSLCGRADFLVFSGRPRKTPTPIIKVFLINKSRLSELNKERILGF